jgi:hypothetical protein
MLTLDISLPTVDTYGEYSMLFILDPLENIEAEITRHNRPRAPPVKTAGDKSAANAAVYTPMAPTIMIVPGNTGDSKGRALVTAGNLIERPSFRLRLRLHRDKPGFRLRRNDDEVVSGPAVIPGHARNPGIPTTRLPGFLSPNELSILSP